MQVQMIDTGQHAKTTRDLEKIFSLPPGFRLHDRQADIATFLDAFAWMWQLIKLIPTAKRNVFNGLNGPVLVHGDTVSTLVATILGRMAHLPVVHVESGLRSWSWRHPFPEEIIRTVVMRLSQYCIAPCDDALKNLYKMGMGKRSRLIQGNTVEDAMAAMLPSAEVEEHKVLACIHRLETIRSAARLRRIMDCICRLAREGWKITFVLHPATEHALRKFRLLDTLRSAGIALLPLQTYPEFLRHMVSARFVVADGGSIQEECTIIDKPCLVPRAASERSDGIGRCVYLVDSDWERWQVAIESVIRNKRAIKQSVRNEASLHIAQWLKQEFSGGGYKLTDSEVA